ncbi:hypothetical protein [Clostridium fungisolvens]|uniref:Lantibiotic n=1 Tax=Clostridium fungisolvens TaxID=1604897 RepID=A0A6V8SKQ4_9CLOT|nr:hypothetical protein [Clostridium fungisolvens]GFP77746.1 hypothetical protein bsdtw1_03917 [Clostridium fungisolvens]GFP77747.1 hypothetical protein bsdtw1_03918 [Clostridium fungisolvens]
MENKIVSLNENLELDQELDTLFEDLTERVEFGPCAANFSPCGANGCIGAC